MTLLRGRERRRHREEREDHVIRRERARDAANIEAAQVLRAVRFERTQEDRADQSKAAQDEEEIHPEEDGERRRRPTRGRGR